MVVKSGFRYCSRFVDKCCRRNLPNRMQEMHCGCFGASETRGWWWVSRDANSCFAKEHLVFSTYLSQRQPVIIIRSSSVTEVIIISVASWFDIRLTMWYPIGVLIACLFLLLVFQNDAAISTWARIAKVSTWNQIIAMDRHLKRWVQSPRRQQSLCSVANRLAHSRFWDYLVHPYEYWIW